MPEYAIEVKNLGKQYIRRASQRSNYRTLRDRLVKRGETNQVGNDKFWALRGVNLTIPKGEVVGLIGPNGAGKSTLLKILSRVTHPTEGEFSLRGRVASMLEVGTGFHPELTGRENVFLSGAIMGMRRNEIQQKFDEIVAFAGVEAFLDLPVKRYSSGMYVRLGFAVAAHLEAEILLVDEVLAVGDAAFRRKCLGKMERVASNGRTILLVSHNMAAINSICSSALLVDKGVVLGKGTASAITNLYLGQNSLSFKKYADEWLTAITVKHLNGEIELEASYSFPNDQFRLPHLGFVIYNSLGIPLFGANPTLQNKGEFPSIRKRNGKVLAKINSPKLGNGTYSISIWFGDGFSDRTVDEHALRFTIDNSDPNYQTLGDVIPSVDFSFI